MARPKPRDGPGGDTSSNQPHGGVSQDRSWSNSPGGCLWYRLDHLVAGTAFVKAVHSCPNAHPLACFAAVETLSLAAVLLTFSAPVRRQLTAAWNWEPARAVLRSM